LDVNINCILNIAITDQKLLEFLVNKEINKPVEYQNNSEESDSTTKGFI